MNTVTRNLIQGIVKRAGGFTYEVNRVINAFMPSPDAANDVVTSLQAIAPTLPINRYGCQITITE